MSGRKLHFRYENIEEQEFSAGLESDVRDISLFDDIGIQANFTGSPVGNLILQGSLDWQKNPPPGSGNWVTLGSIPVSAAGSKMGNFPTLGAMFVRTIFEPTGAGAQTIEPVADTGVRQSQTVTSIADTGVAQISQIVTVADVAGSLNSTFFLISSVNAITKAQKDFYVWLDNGTGVDPMVPGATGVQVTYTDNDADTAIATAVANALAALSNDFASANAVGATITVTNLKPGLVTDAIDGSAATGFTITTPTPGVDSNLNDSYFTLTSINTTTKLAKNFYMWFNVDSLGTDPAVAGRTAIPVALSASDSANDVATAMRAALNALTGDFAATGAGADVIITNVAFGEVAEAEDGAAPTGFTFGAATPGEDSNLNDTYFFLYNANDAIEFYVWFNVDGIGTDPALAGLTGIEVQISSGATAGTVGSTMAAAIQAADSGNSFTASGTTTVTVTNVDTGPFTLASDSEDAPTGFDFAGTTGTGTMNAWLSGKQL